MKKKQLDKYRKRPGTIRRIYSCPEELWLHFAAFCKQHDLKQSRVIVKLVEDFLKNQEKIKK